jgi:hypothetical protein
MGGNSERSKFAFTPFPLLASADGMRSALKHTFSALENDAETTDRKDETDGSKVRSKTLRIQV